MGYARKMQISLKDTLHYHCMVRCVRRAWLWGFDQYAGRDYSHRKQWVIDRLRELSQAFAIDVCAYAVMSNHYHTVVCVELERAQRWSEAEVVERWTASRVPVLTCEDIDVFASLNDMDVRSLPL